MIDESFRMKALHEVYELHYDEEHYRLSSQLVNEESTCDAPKLAEVISISDGIAGLDGSTIVTNHNVALMPSTPTQLPQLHDVVAHNEF
jgi:hypothetical protein